MSATTHARLLDAAIHRYGREGFHRTATAQVAADAQVSSATLFRHFPTLGDLVHAAHYHAQLKLLFLLGGQRPRDTLYGYLRGYWEALIERALTEGDAFRYCALFDATPGYGALPQLGEAPASPKGGLSLWQPVGPLLTRASGEAAGHSALLVRLLEAQWTATVTLLLARGALSLNVEGRAFIVRLFDGWWAAVGLDRATPFPATPPAEGYPLA